MPGALDQLLDVERRIGEGLLGLERGLREGPQQLALRAGDPHPLAAPSGGRLQQDRVARLRGDPRRLSGVGDLPAGARDGRQAEPRQGLLRGHLVAHEGDRPGGRPDERQFLQQAPLREQGVLGKEPVAGVDRLAVGLEGRLEDRLHLEVRIGAARGAEADRPGRLAQVGRPPVSLGVDRHRLDPQGPAGSNDAGRDLPAVGDQDPAKHRAILLQPRSLWNRSPARPAPPVSASPAPAGPACPPLPCPPAGDRFIAECAGAAASASSS